MYFCILFFSSFFFSRVGVCTNSPSGIDLLYEETNTTQWMTKLYKRHRGTMYRHLINFLSFSSSSIFAANAADQQEYLAQTHCCRPCPAKETIDIQVCSVEAIYYPVIRAASHLR